MEHPIDILLIVTHEIGLHHLVPDKPKIEINRHHRPGIILTTMLCQRLAVDEIFHVSIGHLRYESMPAGNASIAGVKDVVFFPIRLVTKGPTRSCKQSSPNTAPAPVR